MSNDEIIAELRNLKYTMFLCLFILIIAIVIIVAWVVAYGINIHVFQYSIPPPSNNSTEILWKLI